MNKPDKHNASMLLGGQARNIAAWMALVASMICFGRSFWMSWPLGPDFVDEGGVTRIRLAIATLVFGQALAFGFLLFYVRDIHVLVKKLAEDSSKSLTDKFGDGSGHA